MALKYIECQGSANIVVVFLTVRITRSNDYLLSTNTQIIKFVCEFVREILLACIFFMNSFVFDKFPFSLTIDLFPRLPQHKYQDFKTNNMQFDSLYRVSLSSKFIFHYLLNRIFIYLHLSIG